MEQKSFEFSGTTGNFQSSQLVLDQLMPFFTDVHTILDLGCGMGAWSKAFMDKGFKDITLVDHPSVPLNQLLIEEKHRFMGVDLDKALPPPLKVDLVICIEVLEHFKTQRSIELLNYMCNAADLILFSAAIPHQGGNGHINCQRHNFWHSAFSERGFNYFDGFKPMLIHNVHIHFWLRQNLFIYYRPSKAYLFEGLQNITAPGFELVNIGLLRDKIGLKEYLKMAPSVFGRLLTRLLNRAAKF